MRDVAIVLAVVKSRVGYTERTMQPLNPVPALSRPIVAAQYNNHARCIVYVCHVHLKST